MEASKLYMARVQVVEAMEQGLPWHEAVKLAGLQISQSTAYRLRQRMRQGGKQALQEGRHGHPAKLRGPVQQCLKDYCQAAPGTPSRIAQQALQNRCGIVVSISHLNATRAALGLGSRATPLREKNQRKTQASNPNG